MVHSLSEPRACHRFSGSDQHSGAEQQRVSNTTFDQKVNTTSTSMNFVKTSPYLPTPVYHPSGANPAYVRSSLFPPFSVYGPSLAYDPCASSAAWWMPVPAPVSHGFDE